MTFPCIWTLIRKAQHPAAEVLAHPECPKALAAYSNYKAMRQQAVREYMTAYGPLNRYQVNDDNYFDWVDKPWPWERECGC